MSNWSKRISVTAVLIGGMVAATAVAAGAKGLGGHDRPERPRPVQQVTSVLSDNGLGAAVGNLSPSVPVNVCGNSVSVLGRDTQAWCDNVQVNKSKGDAAVKNGKGHRAGGGTGILSDNKLGAAVGNLSPSVPVNVCGNSVSVLGKGSVADCHNTQINKSKGGAKVRN